MTIGNFLVYSMRTYEYEDMFVSDFHDCLYFTFYDMMIIKACEKIKFKKYAYKLALFDLTLKSS